MKVASTRVKYVIGVIRRRFRELPAVVQDDLAQATGRDRSGIAHILAERHHLPADELDVWCDVLDTIEPLESIARRLGYRLVPLDRPASEATVERWSWALMRQVGEYGRELGTALVDGLLDEGERERLERMLAQLSEVVEGLRARLRPPEVPRD